jgi:Small subunit of serine palmitoyltransferase-like
MSSKFFANVKDLILKYEVTLGLYMLEPWEKCIFNCLALIFAMLLVYATQQVVPAWQNFSGRIAYYLTDSS